MNRKVFLVKEHTTSLPDVLRTIGISEIEAQKAVHDGRVFVNLRRVATLNMRLVQGDDVVLQPRVHRVPLPEPFVLAECEGLVAVHKPSGISTLADQRSSAHTLLDETAKFLHVKPQNLHATSRLDRDVSGVVLFALTPARIKEVLRARELGTYQRRYVALAIKSPDTRFEPGAIHHWNWPIGPGAKPHLRRVCALHAKGADIVSASSEAKVIASNGQSVLFSIEPKTGRTHQIRVHASHALAPLLGDTDYGDAKKLTMGSGRVIAVSRVALHCAYVKLELADSSVCIEVKAPVPELFEEWVRAVALSNEPKVLLEQAASG